MDLQLDILYDIVDEWMRTDRIDRIDLMVELMDVYTPLDLLLGMLTATLPVKTRLKQRDLLITVTRVVIRVEGQDPDEILKGLI